MAGKARVGRGPGCGGGGCWGAQDVDPKIGLGVIGIAILISAGFYYVGLDLVAYGILAGATLIDLAIYSRLSDLTVCYHCHAEFRGDYEQTAGAFDLHTADLLEPEYERKVGIR